MASHVVIRNPVVCYHYPCPDGIFSALAAHLFFRGKESPRFVPLTVTKNHDVRELELQGSETVFMCDYTGPPGLVASAAQVADRVVILDHHKTAADRFCPPATVPENVEVHIDMLRSGATIAKDFFGLSGGGAVSADLERMYAHIEDGDLWRWQLPGSRAFYAGLAKQKLEYDAVQNPGIFDQLLQLDLPSLISQGEAVLEKQQHQITRALAGSFQVTVGGASGLAQGWGSCLAVRADALSHLRSQLGNDLAGASQKRGLRAIGIVAYCDPAIVDTSMIKLSLRAREGEDTTVVSEHFGGGGHRLASSCIVPLAEFESWHTGP